MKTDEKGSHSQNPEAIQLFFQEKYSTLMNMTAKNPHDEKTWDTIVNLALVEKEQGIETYLPTVPLDEMITIGRQLQTALTQEERYHILLQPCSNGALWYDITQSENEKNLSLVIPLLEEERQVRWRKFERGLDIGTGSGNAAKVIAPYCEYVVGMDILHEALQKAADRSDIGEHALFAQGDVTYLPYKNESFDLVISNGLNLYLSKEAERQQNEEINRVLRPGGLYVTVLGAKPEDTTIHGAKDLLKNIMSWMIVSAVPKKQNQAQFLELNDQFISKGYQPVVSKKGVNNLVIGFRKIR